MNARGFSLEARQQWKLLVASLCLFGLGASVWQLLTAKDYKATTLLSVASNDSGSMSGFGAAIGQLGSISSLVGLAGAGGAQRPEPLAILQSRALTEQFISDNNLLPIIFNDRWDKEHARWKSSFFRKDPTVLTAYERFLKIRTVSQDNRTNLVTVSIVWRNPEQAASWTNSLVKLTNEYMRRKALAEAQRNISSLTGQLSVTTLVEVRTALGSLIENQIKQQMLASGNDEYAFKVLDPAVVPEEPSTPTLPIAAACGVLFGCLVFGFFVFLKLTLQEVAST